MELGPIAGIRVMPAIRQRPIDPELIVFFEIESSARPDEDSYSASSKKAAGAEEPTDEDSEEPRTLVGEDSSSISRIDSTGNVNVFA